MAYIKYYIFCFEFNGTRMVPDPFFGSIPWAY